MPTKLTGIPSFAYLGVEAPQPPNMVQVNRAPTTTDFLTYNTGDLWLNIAGLSLVPRVLPTAADIWMLVSKQRNIATWVNFGGGGGNMRTLTGDNAVAVPPNGVGNINILGTANHITVIGNAGTNTLTLDTGANIATTYTEDGATIAVPAAGNLNIFGGANIATAGAGSTVTVALNTANTPWVPVLRFGGSNTGITYSIQQGFYCQIGHVVTFSLAIVLTSKGAQAGTATITGLGFGAVLAVGLQGTCSNLTFANQLAFGTDGTTITFNQLVSGGLSTQLDNTAFANDTILNISGIFQV